MEITKKEKKKKEKKPITTDRVVKWLMPVFLIVIIVLSGYQAVASCGLNLSGYQEIEKELTNDYNVESVLTSNRILATDGDRLIAKLGAEGENLPIFIQGDISYEVYNNKLDLYLSNDLEFDDGEYGEFVNRTKGREHNSFGLKILELTLELIGVNEYKMYVVMRMDISGADLGVKIDLSSVKPIYFHSTSVLKIEDNKLKQVSNESIINGLTGTNNKTMVTLISALFGYGTDVSSELVIDHINNFALKTNTIIEIEHHRFYFINK